MTGFLSDWIPDMTAMALICSVCLAFTPEGRVKSVQKMVCTLAVTIVLLSPLTEIDMDAYAQSLARYREAMLKAEQSGQESADRLIRGGIEQECAAYISDKGVGLGLGAISARVRAKWGDAFWYPYEVWLDCESSEELMMCIEGELGIPRERMHWSDEIIEDK